MKAANSDLDVALPAHSWERHDIQLNFGERQEKKGNGGGIVLRDRKETQGKGGK